jgi:hypothetical protein
MITARLTKSFLNFEDKIFFFEIIIPGFGILALEEKYFLQLSDSVYVAVFLTLVWQCFQVQRGRQGIYNPFEKRSWG